MNISKKYFNEIDSIRALSVIAVIIFHIEKSWLPGGFLGVDIFFVISGFVVTSSLVEKEYRDIKSFLSSFYKKRIKRLYPALLFMLILFFFATISLIADSAPILKTGLWAIFGFGNVQLLTSSSDYFALNTEANLFTHTWSLGVEEQFYLIFPILFFYSSKKLNRIAMLLSLALISYIFFILLAPSTAFYLMPTRLWQLTLGSLIRLSGHTKIAKNFNKHFALLPIILILYCFYSSKEFNLAHTSIISVSAGLLLIFIKETHERFWLLVKPILYIGTLSYSLYLIHWPVLVLVKSTVGVNHFILLITLLIIILLSLFSYNCIEQPFRKKTWTLHTIVLFASCIFIFFFTYKKLPHIKKIVYQGIPKESYGTRSDKIFLPSKKYCVLPVRAKIPKDTEEIIKKNCQIHKSLKSSRKIYALGNSYLEEKLPAIISFAKNYDLNLFYHVTPGVSYSSKNETWKFYLSSLPKYLNPGDIIIFSTPLRNVVSFESFTKDLESATQQLHNKGIQLVFFGGGYPILKEEVVPWNCYQKWSKYNKKCSLASALDHSKNELIKSYDITLSRNKKINYVSIYNEFEVALKNDLEPFRFYNTFNHMTAYANQYLVNKIISYEKFNNPITQL